MGLKKSLNARPFLRCLVAIGEAFCTWHSLLRVFSSVHSSVSCTLSLGHDRDPAGIVCRQSLWSLQVRVFNLDFFGGESESSVSYTLALSVQKDCSFLSYGGSGRGLCLLASPQNCSPPAERLLAAPGHLLKQKGRAPSAVCIHIAVSADGFACSSLPRNAHRAVTIVDWAAWTWRDKKRHQVRPRWWRSAEYCYKEHRDWAVDDTCSRNTSRFDASAS